MRGWLSTITFRYFFGLVMIVGMFVVACGDAADTDPTPLPTPETVATPATGAVATPTPAPTATPEPTATTVTTPTVTAVPTPTATAVPVAEVQRYSYQIVNTFPHDPGAFTQGLEYHDGYLYESTGLYGSSSLRRVDLESGEVLQIHRLGGGYFGEGMTILGDEIYQITFQEQTAFVYDLETFDLRRQYRYETEGWGLANDGERLIMTDGSNTIFFRDPETFEVLDELHVYDDRGPVELLNELEWIDGFIWANIWVSDYVVIIDPETGLVTGRVDLFGLLQPEDQAGRRVDVLNGIAWDAENDRLFVTGKLWPVLYEIELVPLD